MPTTKQELEIFHEDYINSIKRNMIMIGEALRTPRKNELMTPAAVETMASHGLGVKVIASLFGQVSTDISQNPILLASYEKGRANIGARLRASMVDDALNKDMPYAKMHLDKVFNKEEHSQDINLNVTQRPLENISDDALLKIDLDDGTDENK